MAKIVRVGILSELTLDVQLENDNIILFNLNLLTGRPEYAALLDDDRIYYPKTDGERVYWRDGPRLGLDEMIQIMQNEKN